MARMFAKKPVSPVVDVLKTAHRLMANSCDGNRNYDNI